MYSHPKYRAPNLDRHTKHQLECGKYPIDGRIDLHGHTLESARQALGNFLERAWAKQWRCLLVVTGKGKNSPDQRPTIHNEFLDSWLWERTFQEHLLSFCEAQPKDGGSGAFYLLLKRQTRRSVNPVTDDEDLPDYKFD